MEVVDKNSAEPQTLWLDPEVKSLMKALAAKKNVKIGELWSEAGKVFLKAAGEWPEEPATDYPIV